MYNYLQDKRSDPFRDNESLIDLFAGSHIGEIQFCRRKDLFFFIVYHLPENDYPKQTIFLNFLEHTVISSVQNHKGLTTLIDFSSSIFSSVNNSDAKPFQSDFTTHMDRAVADLLSQSSNTADSVFAAELLMKEKVDEEKSINAVRPFSF